MAEAHNVPECLLLNIGGGAVRNGGGRGGKTREEQRSRMGGIVGPRSQVKSEKGRGVRQISIRKSANVSVIAKQVIAF